jgi:restriction system protein
LPLDTDDGTYEIDVTARFKAFGAEYLTPVECKHHKKPIKREVVQVLSARLNSLHAKKGMLFSTADFQSGAIEYALKHKIALIKIANGRTAYITKATVPSSPLPPGCPEYVG